MRRTDPLPLAERLEIEHALEGALAPLRMRRTNVSALRVRAAVRWGRGTRSSALPWSGAVARLSELSLAVGMSVLVFVGAFSPVAPTLRAPIPSSVDEAVDPALYPTPHVSAPLEDDRYIRWLRLDRYVPLQDWLDPTVVHAGVRSTTPLVPPAPTQLDQPF